MWPLAARLRIWDLNGSRRAGQSIRNSLLRTLDDAERKVLFEESVAYAVAEQLRDFAELGRLPAGRLRPEAALLVLAKPDRLIDRGLGFFTFTRLQARALSRGADPDNRSTIGHSYTLIQ